MHHVTLTLSAKRIHDPTGFTIAESYVSDIYSSMVKNNVTVITSRKGKTVASYKGSILFEDTPALIITGMTEDTWNLTEVMYEFRDAPITINVSSYED